MVGLGARFRKVDAEILLIAIKDRAAIAGVKPVLCLNFTVKANGFEVLGLDLTKPKPVLVDCVAAVKCCPARKYVFMSDRRLVREIVKLPDDEFTGCCTTHCYLSPSVFRVLILHWRS